MARTRPRRECALCGAGLRQDVAADSDPDGVPPPASGPVLSAWTGDLFETAPCRAEDLLGTAARSLSEAFEERTGSNPRTDEGLCRAAHWFYHLDQLPRGPRGRGRPHEVLFTACVVATVDYVHRLQRKTRPIGVMLLLLPPWR